METSKFHIGDVVTLSRDINDILTGKVLCQGGIFRLEKRSATNGLWLCRGGTDLSWISEHLFEKYDCQLTMSPNNSCAKRDKNRQPQRPRIDSSMCVNYLQEGEG